MLTRRGESGIREGEVMRMAHDNDNQMVRTESTKLCMGAMKVVIRCHKCGGEEKRTVDAGQKVKPSCGCDEDTFEVKQ